MREDIGIPRAMGNTESSKTTAKRWDRQNKTIAECKNLINKLIDSRKKRMKEEPETESDQLEKLLDFEKEVE